MAAVEVVRFGIGGDSNTYGVDGVTWFEPWRRVCTAARADEEGRPERPGQPPKVFAEPFNLSAPGLHMDEIAAHMRESAPRLHLGAIAFIGGLNDTWMEEGTPYATPKRFGEYVDAALCWATGFTGSKKRVVAFNIPPVNEEYSNPLVRNPRLSFTNERIDKFNQEYAKVCKGRKLPLHPLNQMFRSTPNWEYLLLNRTDGIHWTTQGEDRVGRFVAPILNGAVQRS